MMIHIIIKHKKVVGLVRTLGLNVNLCNLSLFMFGLVKNNLQASFLPAPVMLSTYFDCLPRRWR